uniref:Uncharacterized protein n=1 Tax=Vespula pensylvanica TaxID=30213 RepID=A0A834JFB1_VESPE|nr:hypothetical protein H0235_018290 [Vespula pensylvanica]
MSKGRTPWRGMLGQLDSEDEAIIFSAPEARYASMRISLNRSNADSFALLSDLLLLLLFLLLLLLLPLLLLKVSTILLSSLRDLPKPAAST